MTVGTAVKVAELEAEVRRLRTLLRISTLMNGEMNHARLIERINEEVRDYLQADRLSVFFYDAKSDELYSYIASGLRPGQIRIPTTKGIAGHVFRTGEMVALDDAYDDPRFNREVDRQTGYRTRSLLCLHITNRAGVRIGVVQALNKLTGDGTFTRDDMIFLWEAVDLISDLYASLEEGLTHLAIYATDHEGIVTYVSPAIGAILGFSSSDLVGERLDRFIDADDRDQFTRCFLNVLAGSPSEQAEFRMAARSGEVRWLRASGRPMHAHGVITGLIGQMEDITERRMLEDRLRQAQKIESVGQLAGGIAHDFNNLLVPVLGYAEMAAKKLSENHPAIHDISRILEAAHRARELVVQLLAFGRRQVLDMRVIDVNQTFADFERILRRLVGENIEIVAKLDRTLGRVRADGSQIRQVLMNLFVNARDAMPSGGQIAVETANIYLADDHARQHPGMGSGPFVMLAVRDTGCGMDAETRARIFEPFFTTKGEKGTGLGLATVHGIVAQHNGCIHVESEPGKGTTFRVYLPIAAEYLAVAEETVPAVAPAGQFRGSETVLLVEDEDVVRSFICDVLGDCGYDVIAAESPDDALVWAGRTERPIHLLLTDIVMPRMNGRELWRHVDALRPGMRVIFMSGYAADVLGDDDRLGPGEHFLPKPFTIPELMTLVRSAIDGTPGAQAKPASSS